MIPEHIKNDLVWLLSEYAYPKNEAKVLTVLMSVDRITSREIEIATRLSQPEVSKALSFLLSKELVEFSVQKVKGRGRPVKIWRLRRDVKEIIQPVLKEAYKDLDTRFGRLEKIRAWMDGAFDE